MSYNLCLICGNWQGSACALFLRQWRFLLSTITSILLNFVLFYHILEKRKWNEKKFKPNFTSNTIFLYWLQISYQFFSMILLSKVKHVLTKNLKTEFTTFCDTLERTKLKKRKLYRILTKLKWILSLKKLFWNQTFDWIFLFFTISYLVICKSHVNNFIFSWLNWSMRLIGEQVRNALILKHVHQFEKE